MSDTYTHNGTHGSQDDNDVVDTQAAQTDPMADAARAARTSRTRLVHEIDQLDAERKRVGDQIAQLRAEVERCDSIIEWATKTVKPRGRKATPAAKSTKR